MTGLATLDTITDTVLRYVPPKKESGPLAALSRSPAGAAFHLFNGDAMSACDAWPAPPAQQNRSRSLGLRGGINTLAKHLTDNSFGLKWQGAVPLGSPYRGRLMTWLFPYAALSVMPLQRAYQVTGGRRCLLGCIALSDFR